MHSAQTGRLDTCVFFQLSSFTIAITKGQAVTFALRQLRQKMHHGPAPDGAKRW